MDKMHVLNRLQIKSHNSGAYPVDVAWSVTREAGEFVSIDPATEESIASIYRSSKQDYEKVMQEAQHAFLRWRDIPAPKRGEVIRAIGDELRKYKDDLGSLVSLETGKSKQEGDGEVQEMIDMADFAVGQSRMLYGKMMHSERPLHRMYEQWHPLGVVGIITAFNFPVAVWAWNAFLAAICGNTVIWKPSEKAPLCAIAIQHLCNRVLDQAGCQGVLTLFISDQHEMTQVLANDARVSLVSFTGSTAVGKIIYTTVTNRFGKILLELSGNNAIIVDEGADLTLAIPAIVFSAIGTAGQRCTTTRRLIIHTSIYKKLIKALVDVYQKITIGNPLDPNILMGPLIDKHAVAQFEKTVSEATQEGGRILFGGSRKQGKGFFVEPTLIEVKNHWDSVQRETFAPILYVMEYDTLEEAIAMQNHSAFGLSSSLFTQDLSHAELFLSAQGSDCGIANINIGTSGAEIGGAFGGEKNTGGGREAGSDAWKAYMRRQTNTINWGKKTTLAQGIQFEIA